MPPRDEHESCRPGAVCVAITGLVALAVAMGIGRFAFTPVFPMMRDEFGVPIAEGGWLASANYLGYLIGALSAMRMRVQPAAAIRAGLLIIGLSTVGMALTEEFICWLALRAAAGIASAWVLVFVSAWALESLASAGRSDLSGVVYAGVGSGIAAAGVACVALMSLRALSTDAWMSLGIGSLVATAAIWPSFQPTTQAIVSTAIPSKQGRAWNPESWRLAFCYGAFGFGYIVPATFLPVMAKEAIADPSLFGWAWPVFGAAAAVSTLFAAKTTQLLSYRTLWMIANVVMAIGVVFPVVAPGLAGIAMAALFVGGTFMVITMAGMQEARRVAGERARQLMAAMTSAFALGQIVGPLTVAYLVRSMTGFGAALAIAAVLLTFSALALLRGSFGIQAVAEKI